MNFSTLCSDYERILSIKSSIAFVRLLTTALRAHGDFLRNQIKIEAVLLLYKEASVRYALSYECSTDYG